MAPEVTTMGADPYDTQADIWSFGITAIELAERNPPRYDFPPMKVLSMIPLENPPKLMNPDIWTKEFLQFVDDCLIKDPHKRKKASELGSHSFFQKYNSDLTRLLELHNAVLSEAENLIQEASENWQDFLNQQPDVIYEDSTNTDYTASVVIRPMKETVSKRTTVIDPKTKRPKTLMIDAEIREFQAQKQKLRILVKQQLKEIRKVQEQHSKSQQQAKQKLQLEIDNISKNNQARSKQKEKQRFDAEQQLQKQNKQDLEKKHKENLLLLRKYGKVIEVELKRMRKELEEKDKQDLKNFKEKKQTKLKENKREIKQASGSSAKALSKLKKAEMSVFEMQFQHYQEREKIIHQYLLDIQQEKMKVEKKKELLTEEIELALQLQIKVCRFKLETLECIQEFQVDTQNQIHPLEINQMKKISQLAIDQLNVVLKLQKDLSAKQISTDLKQRAKGFRSRIKSVEKQNLMGEKEYKKQLKDVSKTEVKSLMREKKSENKEILLQQEVDFEREQQEYRKQEEERLAVMQQRQYDSLVAIYERQLDDLAKFHEQKRKKMKEEHKKERENLILSLQEELRLHNQNWIKQEQSFLQKSNSLMEHQKAHQEFLLNLFQKQTTIQTEFWTNSLKRDPTEITHLINSELEQFKQSQQQIEKEITQFLNQLQTYVDSIQQQRLSRISQL